MKSRQRNIIVALMVFALSGLIAFQVYWIKNALQLSQTQFERNVRESLVQVAGQLEEQEAMRLTQNTFVYFKRQPGTEDIETEHKTGVWVDSSPRQQTNFGFRVERDSVIILASPDGKKIEERIRNKVQLVDVAAQRIFTRGNLDITKRLNDDQIDSLLQQALNEKGISIEYNFGVIEDDTSGNDRIVINHIANNDTEVLESKFRASLFPNDIQGPNHFLAVYFPNQSDYVLREIGMTLFASIIFIGIILGSFVYTMKIIGKQKQLSRIKTDFINNMTHEFKTPIATISLAAEVLSETGMQDNIEARKKYIGVIRDENDRLARQVERVLESSMLENNELLLDRELTNVHDLIKGCIDTFQAVNTEFDFEARLDAINDRIMADTHHMENVMNNLLDNAVKYSDTSRKIVVATRNSGENIQITVTDFGIGMEAARQKLIFDNFYRIPTGNLHDVKGFGLGLSYVRRLVELHEGSVTVRSAPGKGSEFTLSLPNA